jgi:hypothetical protein
MRYSTATGLCNAQKQFCTYTFAMRMRQAAAFAQSMHPSHARQGGWAAMHAIPQSTHTSHVIRLCSRATCFRSDAASVRSKGARRKPRAQADTSDHAFVRALTVANSTDAETAHRRKIQQTACSSGAGSLLSILQLCTRGSALLLLADLLEQRMRLKTP